MLQAIKLRLNMKLRFSTLAGLMSFGRSSSFRELQTTSPIVDTTISALDNFMATVFTKEQQPPQTFPDWRDRHTMSEVALSSHPWEAAENEIDDSGRGAEIYSEWPVDMCPNEDIGSQQSGFGSRYEESVIESGYTSEARDAGSSWPFERSP